MSPLSDEARRLLAPVLILAVALFTMVGVRSVELFQQHDSLVALRGSQESAIAEAQKIRQQLSALAEKTAQLANAGDTNARAIVEQLRRQGITINPPNNAPK